MIYLDRLLGLCFVLVRARDPRWRWVYNKAGKQVRRVTWRYGAGRSLERT